jgi:hypothetical protein
MRNFSNKTHVASQPLRRMHTALPMPRVPPRPFKPFARLADPISDVNVEFLANGLRSVSLNNGPPSVPADTVQITVAPAPTPDLLKNAEPSAPSIAPSAVQQQLIHADLAFAGEGSVDNPFTEVSDTATPTPATPEDEHLHRPHVLSEHNPFLARAACWENLLLVAGEHGFDLDECFKLTPKIKSRDARPSSELSALCKGDRFTCPHPSFSPDRRTLGPEYCADRIFFDEYYHDADVDRQGSQRASIRKDVGIQIADICRNAGEHL